MRWVLLCEDLQQERVLRPLLEKRFGQRPRVLRNGSFALVYRDLPKEAAYVRQRRQEAVALVVAADGDAMGFEARLRELREKAGFPPHGDDPQIALCVPTRNIETWILWLNGRDDLDEHIDYKREVDNQKDGGAALARDAAQTWREEAEPRPLESARLPSLTHARAEIRRLGSLTQA